MDERIRTILEYAVMAPSGDNCQPWRFALRDNYLELHNLPEKDTSLYNLKQRASLVAHGAALENICVTAPSVGLAVAIKLFPDQTNVNLIASMSFTECLPVEHELLAAVPKRHTNREAYETVSISYRQRKKWKALVNNTGQQLWLSETVAEKEQLARLLSYNERLIFELPELHQFLFKQLRWTTEEAKQTCDGLDIDTLGMNVLDKYFFKLLQNWQLVSLLNTLGLSKIIELKGRKLLNTASTIAILNIPGTDSKDYVQGGQLWQRFMLSLANEGLTAHPVAGLAFLMQSDREDELKQYLKETQSRRLSIIRNDLQNLTGAGNNMTLLAMFRIGRGHTVARSLRKPVACFVE